MTHSTVKLHTKGAHVLQLHIGAYQTVANHLGLRQKPTPPFSSFPKWKMYCLLLFNLVLVSPCSKPLTVTFPPQCSL